VTGRVRFVYSVQTLLPAYACLASGECSCFGGMLANANRNPVTNAALAVDIAFQRAALQSDYTLTYIVVILG
jgi:hypothetical protein